MTRDRQLTRPDNQLDCKNDMLDRSNILQELMHSRRRTDELKRRDMPRLLSWGINFILSAASIQGWTAYECLQRSTVVLRYQSLIVIQFMQVSRSQTLSCSQACLIKGQEV